MPTTSLTWRGVRSGFTGSFSECTQATSVRARSRAGRRTHRNLGVWLELDSDTVTFDDETGGQAQTGQRIVGGAGRFQCDDIALVRTRGDRQLESQSFTIVFCIDDDRVVGAVG